MNILEAAQKQTHGRVHKIESYMALYEKEFAGMKPKAVLEIGVRGGGSLGMWKEYFPGARIDGVDIDPNCLKYNRDGINVYLGDQADRNFLKELGQEGYDIIIDDGGHTMNQQQTSFEVLFPMLNQGGVYVIEDIHTSYWPAFHDGGNTMKYIFGLVDKMHWWAKYHWRAIPLGKYLDDRGYTRKIRHSIADDIRYITFADSICFIKKERVKKHMDLKIGTP